MIDVPVRVKDALKSGQYRKNYKIYIGDDIWSHKYTDPEIEIYSYVDPMEAEYWTFRAVSITIPNTVTSISIIVNANASNAYMELVWDELTINKHNHSEIFEYDDSKTIITLSSSICTIVGNHTFTIASDVLFSYVTIQYPIDNGYIDNTRLVAESVKFDERMCSGTELKFGLCEGSSIEFQYFNAANLLGKNIQVEVEVEYKNTNEELAWYTIPLGYFDVASCSRQASTGIIKATAYNKLKSSYLDKPINADLLNYVSSSGTNLYVILKDFLSEYGISDLGDVDVPISLSYDIGPSAVGLSYAYKVGDTYQRALDGKRAVIYYARWTIKAPAEWGSDKYYKFMINTSKVYNRMQSDFMSDLGSAGITDRYFWVGAETGVTSDVNGGVTVSSYLSGNYAYSHIMRGCFRIYKTDGSVSDYMAYPSGPTYNIDYENDIDVGLTGIEFELFFPVMFNAEYDIGTDNPSVPATQTISLTDTEKNRIFLRSNVWLYPSQAAFRTDVKVTWGRNVTSISVIKLTKEEVASITNNITLRDLQTAAFELECQYGKLDRTTDLFSGITLGNGSLYPADNLYPADSLYPAGSVEGGYPAMYSKLWADENNVRSFRYLIITYKSTETIDGETKEVEKTLQRTVNASGTDDYNMSDNWVFRNLVWTAEQVGTLADQMVTKMKNIQWFPFEMWCAGLPYLEAGDQIEIWAADGVHPSYILQRTLDGIQNLQDTMINGDLDIF